MMEPVRAPRVIGIVVEHAHGRADLPGAIGTVLAGLLALVMVVRTLWAAWP